MGIRTDRNWQKDSQRLAQIEEAERIGHAGRIEQMVVDLAPLRLKAREDEVRQAIIRAEEALTALFHLYGQGKQ